MWYGKYDERDGDECGGGIEDYKREIDFTKIKPFKGKAIILSSTAAATMPIERCECCGQEIWDTEDDL